MSVDWEQLTVDEDRSFEIADINRIRAPGYLIRVGQRINIPTCATR